VRRWVAIAMLVGALAGTAFSASTEKNRKKELRSLGEYLGQFGYAQEAADTNNGGLWSAQARLGDMAADYRAAGLNDVVQVRVVELTNASASGAVKSSRDFSTSSGISGLAGKIKTAGLQDLLTAKSSTALNGQGQTSSSSQISAVLSGRVAAVLSNGLLVIEAKREVFVDNQRRWVLLRGLARPGDIASDNSVLSTSLSDLELEMTGKGIISDSTRPPNFLMRLLLKIVGF